MLGNDPNKFNISDINGLQFALMTKAPTDHMHRFDEIEGYDHFIKTLFANLAHDDHGHTLEELSGYEDLKTRLTKIETDLQKKQQPIVQHISQPQVVQQAQPQVQRQIETIKEVIKGSVGYKDIHDLKELFALLERKNQPRLIVLAKEPDEDRILNVDITIVNPSGYCLCKAYIELFDTNYNTILSTTYIKDINSETFRLSLLIPENERFKGYAKLVDPMNSSLSVIEYVRLSS